MASLAPSSLDLNNLGWFEELEAEGADLFDAPTISIHDHPTEDYIDENGERRIYSGN